MEGNTTNEMEIEQLKELMLKYADNPELMESLIKHHKKVIQQAEKQKKKELHEQARMQKEQEKQKKEEDLLKKKRRPFVRIKKQLHSLVKVEKSFNIDRIINTEEGKERILNWFYNKLLPFNLYIEGDKSTSVFKTNAIEFVKFLMEVLGLGNFSFLNGSNNPKRPSLYLKTIYGILTKGKALAYLAYIIRQQILYPVRKLIIENTDEKSKNIDVCLLEISFNQLIGDTSIKYMINEMLRDSYDAEIAKDLQHSGKYMKELKMNELPRDIIVKIGDFMTTYPIDDSEESDEESLDPELYDSDYD